MLFLKAIQPKAIKMNILSVASLPVSVQVFVQFLYLRDSHLASNAATSLVKRFIDIGGQIIATARCAISC